MTIEEFIARYEGTNAEYVDGVVRIPGERIPFERPATAPLLVLLAVPGEGRWLDAFQAMAEHLRAGALAVVILDARHATACVYRDDKPPAILQAGDTARHPRRGAGLQRPVGRLFA